jgi:hypothetical protein
MPDARGRKADVEHLVGSGEIAERLGVRQHNRVHSWRQSDESFPEPVAVLGASSGRQTYVWYWPDVEQWALRTGRLPEER